MHEVLFTYLTSESQLPLTPENTDLLKNVFVPKTFKKKQMFLQEGEVCNATGFLVNGAMRQYRLDDDGVDHVVQLMLENSWVGDWESMASGKPSLYYIEAWEETEVLLTSKKHFQQIQNIPAVSKVITNVTDQNVVALHRRLNDAISRSAEERYERLKQTYPEFLQRFPLHVIASYLGITKETLSRIRTQTGQK